MDNLLVTESQQLTPEQIVELRRNIEQQIYEHTETVIGDSNTNTNETKAGREAETGLKQTCELATGEGSSEGSKVLHAGTTERTTEGDRKRELQKSTSAEQSGSISSIGTSSNGEEKHYSKLAFDNPAQLYAYFRPAFQTGEKSFHFWQAEELLRISQDGIYTVEEPLKLLIAACNGSGKDSYVIAPVSIWLVLCKIRHRVIITSSSYNQINTQTEPYITDLAETINRYYNEKIFTCIKGLITCNLSGSEIRLSVTDEPGRVEGYHPFDDPPGAEMTVILNEAKSIPDEIIQATQRWTGFTRWIEVSSTARRRGKFYEKCQMATSYPKPHIPGEWYMRKVTVYDCPHISKSQLKDDETLFGGISSEFYRSKNLSEFTSEEGELLVVTSEAVARCILDGNKWDGDSSVAAGLDLSLGGDEVSLTSRMGNLAKMQSNTRERDATKLRDWLNIQFPKHNLTKDDPIYTDASGLGDPICDMLIELGWRILKIKNNTRALKPNLYANRGTEIYFNVGTNIASNSIAFGILANDKRLLAQLSNRHYERPDNDKFALWSKRDEKKTTLLGDSPDRADSFVLCFANFEPTEKSNKRRERQRNISSNYKHITQHELVDIMSHDRFAGFDGDINIGGKHNTVKSFAMLNQTALLEHNLKITQQK